jgi:8-oxo-dGTP pyrophosphatase MutT (NUDIX family)
MPQPVSRKQYRYMMAVLHGDAGSSSRGDRVPKSVAGKYYTKEQPKDLPESKGKEHEGGKWTEAHHAKAKEKTKAERKKRKEAKKARKDKVRKSFEEFYKGRGAGCLVVNEDGKILLGRRHDTGDWSTPGGHVEGVEDFDVGATRELREETGLVAKDHKQIHEGHYHGNDTKTYLVTKFGGKLKSNGELHDLKWFDSNELPWENMRQYAVDPIKQYLTERSQLTKSLKDMVALETLEKNIIRSNATPNAVHEVTHGDALKVIGNGTFRMLRDLTKDMGDEDFKEATIDQHTIHIRKHTTDVYSGRITDGQKMIHQFTNRSLPALAVELMSLFEWYMPEDEPDLEILDESQLADDAIEGGLSTLMDNYKRHNISNIYQEMETIRQEIRHGNAVDLQQAEIKIMKLFDNLEENLHTVVDKHNELADEVGGDLDELEEKLRDLQSKVDALSKQPQTIEAYSSNPPSPAAVHENSYPYLPRPAVEISPDGRIKITFSADWSHLEKENFLTDLRAKAITKKK